MDKNIITQFKILYKNCSDFIYDFSNVMEYPINGTLTKMYSSTPSIVEVDDGYIVNIRYVNYTLDSLFVGSTYSLNKYLKLDFSFMKKGEYLFDYTFSKESLKHYGLEDIKHFTDSSGDSHFIGSVFQQKKSCMVLGKTKFDRDTFNKPLQLFKTNFTNNAAWEKNWAYVNYLGETCIVYSWSPVILCRINYSTNVIFKIKEISVPFKNARGSSNGYICNDEIWFVVHVNNQGDYYHHFVVFDLSMNYLRHSEYFKFEGNLVEFCLGLLVYKIKAAVSYSTNDNTSKIMVMDIPSLQWN